MPGVIIVTGKLGGGKSLVSVHRIKEYLERGSIVATNLDLRLHKMFGKNAKSPRVIRLPDKPSIEHLEAIGNGNPSYDEEKNGLLVLDECGTWFNSRNWNDKSRKAVNDWFLHARKLGWDVILIIQDISLLDSQAREAIAEHTAFCRRLDRISVPFIGGLVKLLTGGRLKGPKIHSARVVYGTSEADLLSDRWIYRGVAMYQAYDTKQRFTDSYPHGPHSLLTPWHLYGRYQKPWTQERIMRLTKIHFKSFQAPIYLAFACFLGVVVSMLGWPFMQVSLQQRAAMIEQLAPVEVASADLSEVVQGEELVDLPAALPGVATPVVPQPLPLAVKDRFAGFRIAAYVSESVNKYYLVQGPDGSVFTDSQLRSMGLRVFTVSECELMVTDAVAVGDKAHIFLPGCVPNDGRPRRDLLDTPYFANIKPARF